MDAVKAFNAELSALYDVKPPISKAKMNSLTRGAIKAIKFYKHVVQSVEKFIQKCKPEYKVPGLYVIDSIVRQSRHQFGIDKDVFAPRFAKNMQTTFLNLLKCLPEDKSKVIRVLNLWQKNAVFQPEVIQPLFDLADPNHPIHKEQSINTNGALNASSSNNLSMNSITKTPPSVKGTPKDQKQFSSSKQIDPAWLAQTKLETANMVNANKLLNQSTTNQVDVALFDQLQHLQQLLLKKQEAANEPQSSVKFDKKLLDFDYGEEEDDDVIVASSPAAATTALNQHNAPSGSLESLGLLLTNPEVLRQLQTLQQTMQGGQAATQHEMEEKMRKLQQMKQQEDEFDKHLAQTVPNLPFASECDLKPSDVLKPNPQNAYAINAVPGLMQQDMSQPPPGYPPALPYASQPPTALRVTGQPLVQDQKSPIIDDRSSVTRRDSSSVEIVNLDPARSQSRSPDRFRRHSRSRSPRHRDRDRDRDRDRERKSRSRSRSRRRRSRSRERDRKREDSREKLTEEDREKQKERKKRGLPPIVREKLSVCSTTLWVGHLSKLVHQEELSDTFGELGDIVSIDLISPRGCAFICMNRRQDAYRALTKLKSHKMQGKAITLAWAPGKGVKGKEWKDYWEVELGVSYIPWNKLNNVTEFDLEMLEEGGMIDEDTLPPRLIGKLKHSGNGEGMHQHQHPHHQPPPLQLQHSMPVSGAPIPTLTDGIVNVMQSSSGNQQNQPIVDTSQPPPSRQTNSGGLLPPPNPQLPPMMPPGFPMPRMLGPMGLQMPHGLMPNVPIGVPPPNMQGLLGPPGMMQPMMNPPVNSPFGTGVGVGLITQIPLPAPAAPSDKSNSTGMPHNVPPMGVPPPTSDTNLANLPMMRQPPFGVGPPPPPIQMPHPQQPPHHHQHHSDDMDMDMDMDDAPPQSIINGPKDKPNLSDQLLAAIGKGPMCDSGNRIDGNDRDFRDRERERDRDSRERRDRGDRMDSTDARNDRGRDRGRGRDRVRDGRRREGRDGRDRDRDDRRDRDRNSREPVLRHSESVSSSALGPDTEPKKDPKPSLADRLRQLADGTLPIDDRMDRNIRGDRSDRSTERNERPPPSFDEISGNRRLGDQPPSLMDLPKFPTGPPQDRPDFGPRGGDFRGGPQDMRDFQPRGGPNDRDRPNFGPRGAAGPPRGPMEEFSDPRMIGGRFPDDFDGRLGPNGPRPDEFDPRIGMPREDFDRPEIRGRHPGDDYEQERFGFDIRPREGGFDPRIQEGFDPRSHPDHPEFEPRRRDFFGAPIDPGFGPPPMMGIRGPQRGGHMGPDGFGPRGPPGPMGPRGHGPPMFHPRGMGPRGMRPGMRPPFGPGPPPRGPPFDPREGDAFFRMPFDDNRGPPSNLMRPPFGGPPGPPLPGAEPPWRNQENGPPPGSWSPAEPSNDNDADDHGQRENLKHSYKPQDSKSGSERSDRDRERERDRDRDRDSRNRSRKSRWGNVSPLPSDRGTRSTMSERDCDEDSKMQLDSAFGLDANDNSPNFNDVAESRENDEATEQLRPIVDDRNPGNNEAEIAPPGTETDDYPCVEPTEHDLERDSERDLHRDSDRSEERQTREEPVERPADEFEAAHEDFEAPQEERRDSEFVEESNFVADEQRSEFVENAEIPITEEREIDAVANAIDCDLREEREPPEVTGGKDESVDQREDTTTIAETTETETL